MLSAILGASGAAKMPFYEAADHVFASPSQLDHIHTYTYVLARSPHGPRARRSTGEMFQSTRLKGQLTLSCLAARIVVVPSALSLRVAPLAFLFRRVVFILPSSFSIRCILVALIFLSASFPAFIVYPVTIPVRNVQDNIRDTITRNT